MPLSPLTRFSRYVWVSAWYAFAAVVVVLATGFALARLLLPFADQYHAELGERLSQYFDQPVRMRTMDAEWHGWEPSLVLQDVALLDAVDRQPVLRLKKIRLGLDLLGSLRQWQPVFSNITLVGADLVLTRDAQGQISLAGFSGQADVDDSAKNAGIAMIPSEDSAPYMTWLFSQGRLSIENSNITWHDEMGAGRNMHLSGVTLRLHNDGDRHQLDASVALSRDLGKSLILRVDMWGDPLSKEGRNTQVYMAGEQVNLAELFEPQTLGDVNVSINSAGFQIWGRWHEGVLKQLSGNVAARGLSMRSKVVFDSSQALSLERMEGNFSWQRTADGWQLEGDKLMLARKSRQWQPARVSVHFAKQADTEPTIDAAASYLQLEDISELLSMFAVGGDKLQQPLQTIWPRGEIKDAHLHWQGGDVAQYQAYATLRGATVNAWQTIPSAVNVDGQLWLDSAGGQVALQHAALTLDFPSLFRWPLYVASVRGQVAWEVGDGQWRIAGRNLKASNDDVTASATLDVIKDATHDSPFMSLVADFQDGDGSQVPQYLPTGIMPGAAVSWLDKAFVSAHLVSGGAVFHGRLADFPFDGGQGKFEVAFTVDNASLNYAEAWPPITDINADVRFEGRGMFVDVQRGNIYSNQIRWANVGIKDMTASPMLLTVDGDVWGDTQEKLDYLVVSPQLNAAFGQHLEDMTATGDSLLHLDLDLPIGGAQQVLVDGWVMMKENTLSIPSLGRVLSNVDGRLNFFQDGVQAENIYAELLGQTTKLNIATEQQEVDRRVRIRAGGLFDAPDLAARYAPVLENLLTGAGEWDVVFDIPLSEKKKDNKVRGTESEERKAKAERPARLHVRTDLKGVASRLPPPFDKTVEDVGNLELRIDFRPQQAPVMRVNYAGFVDSIFTLGGISRADDFRGEVRFNSGMAVMPAAPGLHATGWLDRVSLDEWRSLFLSRKSQADLQPAVIDNAIPEATQEVTELGFVPWKGEPIAKDNGLQLLGSADIAVRLFEAYGQQLHNARLILHTQDATLSAEISAQELKGHLTLPYSWKEKPIVADLSYWYLEKTEPGEGEVDPRNMPALDISVDDFRFQNSRFGKFRLETTRVADGLRIEQLVLQPKSTTMTARGGWYVRGNQQQSNLIMHLQSTDIGRTLTALDYVGGIDKGKGGIDFELNWPGSFIDVDAQGIQGNLTMSLKDGYVLDVNPGAGRMFGLLSIQALPRRLLLDFSDVFKKGFGFDRIKGNFKIEGGNAYTDNLYMEGPAARVDIRGRAGLAQKDYDQLVTVTPHVGDTLPLLGVLAATPQVGAAILAVQKLFKPQIDDVARNQYTITGSWNEPLIKKVKAKKSAVDKSADVTDEIDL